MICSFFGVDTGTRRGPIPVPFDVCVIWVSRCDLSHQCYASVALPLQVEVQHKIDAESILVRMTHILTAVPGVLEGGGGHQIVNITHVHDVNADGGCARPWIIWSVVEWW